MFVLLIAILFIPALLFAFGVGGLSLFDHLRRARQDIGFLELVLRGERERGR